MSKSQHEKNIEIASFVEQKQKANEAFTVDEIEYIQQYTGAGGLASSGAAGRGLLYEYYTPHEIVKKMWGLVYKHGFVSGKILEPSCGIGRFFKYINPEVNEVDAFEFSKDNATSYHIAKASYPWVDITNYYFESIFYRDNKRITKENVYDLVIGNPPYGKFSGAYAGKKREGRYFTGSTYDQYFIWAGIELLKPGGLLAFIIPSSFLQNKGKYINFKTEVEHKAELLEAYRLPRRVFATTQVQTDIIILRKKA